eukprot:2963879-Pyramimonas_sp.AAC.1
MHPRPKSTPAPSLRRDADDGPGPAQSSDERARARARRGEDQEDEDACVRCHRILANTHPKGHSVELELPDLATVQHIVERVTNKKPIFFKQGRFESLDFVQ